MKIIFLVRELCKFEILVIGGECVYVVSIYYNV